MAMSPRLLRPLATGFDPRRIANLGLWLDAADASSLTLNGSTVSEWRDKSGNARNFAQATAAAQPIADTRTQNGRPVLDFDGARRLTGNAASLNVARNLAGATVFVVGGWDSTAGNQNMLFVSRGDSSTSPRQRLIVTSATIGFGGRRLDLDALLSAAYSANTNSNVLTGVFDWSNTDLFTFQNGTQQASNLNFHTAGNTTDNDSVGIGIGADPNGTGPLDGFVAEVVYYQRVLSEAERQAVNRYLGAKWGITVA
jgi:hypothetical protein